MRRFMRECRITAETRILDIGGTPYNWEFVPVAPSLVMLNRPDTEEQFGSNRNISWVAGDGCELPFRDGAFDIVFSNSVIEHVGDAARQQRFACEVARVGRAYWVQTPSRWFPVEQHLLTPFVHWMPKPWQSAIFRRFTVWGVLTHASQHRREWYVEHFLRDIRLLSAGELASLFPGAHIIRERFCGWTKSLIAWRER
jgi:hypothetical protein